MYKHLIKKGGSAVIALALLASIPLSAGAAGYGGGGGGGGGSPLPCTPDGFKMSDIKFTINNGDTNTRTRTVRLQMSAGSANQMVISSDPSFDTAQLEPYASFKDWTLPDGIGKKSVYVRFYFPCSLSTANLIGASINFDPSGSSGSVTSGQSKPLNEGQVLGEKITLIDELIARLKFGQRDADVATLQSELQRLGYIGKFWKPTTFYGNTTRAAVARYLADRDLRNVDIDALIAKLKFGTRSAEVNLLQRALQAKGFFPKGFSTFFYGPITKAAVAKYLASK